MVTLAELPGGKAAPQGAELPVPSESSSAGTSMSGRTSQADTLRLRISSGGRFVEVS